MYAYAQACKYVLCMLMFAHVAIICDDASIGVDVLPLRFVHRRY